MSTEIKDIVNGDGPHHLWANASNQVWMNVREDGRACAVAMPRADFIAAVETELGVIVIDKADLPEVTHREGCGDLPWYGIGDRHSRPVRHGEDASTIRAEGMRALALAAHLDAEAGGGAANVARVIAEMRAADVERTGFHLEDAQYRGMVLRLLDAGLLATAPLATKDAP